MVTRESEIRSLRYSTIETSFLQTDPPLIVARSVMNHPE